MRQTYSWSKAQSQSTSVILANKNSVINAKKVVILAQSVRVLIRGGMGILVGNNIIL
jgi:hypothetical protein